MTSEYNVIGEHKDDEHHLLVLGDDGQHYDFSLTTERFEPVQVDDSWRVDNESPDVDEADGLVGPEPVPDD